MNCPKCSSDKKVKSGFVNGKQRYKCKECSCNFTVEIKSTAKSKSKKKNALHLYLEGLGFRSIGRYLNVSHVAVYNWIKSYGEVVEKLRADNEIEVVELDEMHTYIQQKKLLLDMDCLIDMEKDLSISLLATGALKQEKYYGKR